MCYQTKALYNWKYVFFFHMCAHNVLVGIFFNEKITIENIYIWLFPGGFVCFVGKHYISPTSEN